MPVLNVIGIRHHSPACARLVQQAIAEQAPRYVLIEGPSDMNARLHEMALAHSLPLALFSYRLGPAQPVRGSWWPFCAYSPEWVALRHGLASGAQVRFIDLPGWEIAFDAVENRSRDRGAVRIHLEQLARATGFDCSDALWDHLFEGPHEGPQSEEGASTLPLRLATFFAVLREAMPAEPQDLQREAHMAQWIAWAMGQAAPQDTVLVVCGGFHKPALEHSWRAVASGESQPSQSSQSSHDDAVRTGSYLVPYSFAQLDAFAGSEAGMPSPAYYQVLWDQPHGCAEVMLRRTAEHLRDNGLAVSTADLLATHTLAHGLARLRGHGAPQRVDLLDALLGALVKEALKQPAPWSVRGPLQASTDPVLRRMVEAFCGDARGALHPATPRPPLVRDAHEALGAVGLTLTPAPTRVAFDPFSRQDQARQVLTRLCMLDIPGVARVQRGSAQRGEAEAQEMWELQLRDDTEATLIVRAAYGATLLQAATGRCIEALEAAREVASMVHWVELALHAGLAHLADSWVRKAFIAVQAECDFGALGEGIAVLHRVLDAALPAPATQPFAPLLVAAFERALWLLESLGGTLEPSMLSRCVSGIAVLRDCARQPRWLPPAALVRLRGVLQRCGASPAMAARLRGAALGALASLPSEGPIDPANTAAATAMRTPTPELGDFLAGLLALARDTLTHTALLGHVDARVAAMAADEFLGALPALRQAFAYLPPREREAVATRVLALRGASAVPEVLLKAPIDAYATQQGAQCEAAVWRVLTEYGLLGEPAA